LTSFFSASRAIALFPAFIDRPKFYLLGIELRAGISPPLLGNAAFVTWERATKNE
jgi:hypothetical protein